jgi:hypothetical protein
MVEIQEYDFAEIIKLRLRQSPSKDDTWHIFEFEMRTANVMSDNEQQTGWSKARHDSNERVVACSMPQSIVNDGFERVWRPAQVSFEQTAQHRPTGEVAFRVLPRKMRIGPGFWESGQRDKVRA